MFTAGLRCWARSLGNGNIEIYVFLEKYLHDFRYKICLESAWHWLSILLKPFFVKSPFSSRI
jgi:hypothetical protein